MLNSYDGQLNKSIKNGGDFRMMKAHNNDSSLEAQDDVFLYEECKNSQHTLLNSHNFSFNFGNGNINSDHDSGNKTPTKRKSGKFMNKLNNKGKKIGSSKFRRGDKTNSSHVDFNKTLSHHKMGSSKSHHDHSSHRDDNEHNVSIDIQANGNPHYHEKWLKSNIFINRQIEKMQKDKGPELDLIDPTGYRGDADIDIKEAISSNEHNDAIEEKKKSTTDIEQILSRNRLKDLEKVSGVKTMNVVDMKHLAEYAKKIKQGMDLEVIQDVLNDDD